MTEDETGGTPVPPVSALEDQGLQDRNAGARPAPSSVYGSLEKAVLGGEAYLTSDQVVEATGVGLDRLTTLWRALGFPSPEPEDAVFVDADVKAIGQLSALLGSGLLSGEDEGAMVRTLGRTFARLAEWEIGQLTPALAALGTAPSSDASAGAIEEALADLVGGFLPMVQDLQDYVWRRHLVSAAARALGSGGAPGVDLAVGFADIVNFTRTSRKLTRTELSALVETFEATVSEVIHSQGGRVIKTIGDEVLFACDSPTAAAQIAIDLAQRHGLDESFPEVRVGLAYGPVLARLGDVFGEVVNIAARLTPLARPGTVLINAELAALLDQDESGDFRVRRVPAERVRGYSRLQPWALRPGDPDRA